LVVTDADEHDDGDDDDAFARVSRARAGGADEEPSEEMFRATVTAPRVRPDRGTEPERAR
jgi:hypothetical protein